MSRGEFAWRTFVYYDGGGSMYECRLILITLLTAAITGCQRAAPPATAVAAVIRLETGKDDRVGATFGTYNVHGLGDAPRLRQDLGRLDFVDAWAFQEVTLPVSAPVPDKPVVASLPELEAILPAGRWHLAYVPVNRVADDRWEGQAVASRFPIRRVEVWILDRSASKHRVALAAWLDAPGGEILFVNADHEIGGLGALDWPGPGDRAKQIRSLAAKLRETADTPTVLAGDFNTSGSPFGGVSEAAEIADLNRALGAVGMSGLGPEFDRTPTFHWAGVGYHLDHVFLRRLTADAWDVSASARGSDHRPVWCRVRSR